MKALGILTAASLTFAPAFAGAGSTDTTENNRPESGPVASAAHQIGKELTPDVLIPLGTGLFAMGMCIAFCGGGGGGTTTTTTTTSR